ncbi:MAG: rhomboid family intramembrane serine protease [Desulfobacterales bacterium]
MVPLRENLSQQQARTYSLVCSVLNIRHSISRCGEHWTLSVAREDAARAREALSRYEAHNPPPDPAGEIPRRSPGAFSGLWAAALLAGMHLARVSSDSPDRVVNACGASAGAILQGEWYRTITALMIHADALHLVGNLVGIALFGTAVASICGWGLGWLMVLASGGLGNALNAVFFRSGHLSVGSSTAIFGALGILSAIQFARRIRTPGERFRALLPLGGGLALLAVLGTAQNSDLLAHLFGFAAGMSLGGAFALLTEAAPGRRCQFYALAAAAVCIGFSSWACGLGGFACGP